MIYSDKLSKAEGVSDDFVNSNSEKIFYGYVKLDTDCKEKIVDLALNSKKKTRTDMVEYNNRKYMIFSCLYPNKPHQNDVKAFIHDKYIPAKIKVIKDKTGNKTIEILELIYKFS